MVSDKISTLLTELRRHESQLPAAVIAAMKNIAQSPEQSTEGASKTLFPQQEDTSNSQSISASTSKASQELRARFSLGRSSACYSEIDPKACYKAPTFWGQVYLVCVVVHGISSDRARQIADEATEKHGGSKADRATVDAAIRTIRENQ